MEEEMPDVVNAQRRLRCLSEISKLLITFESIEKSVDAALGLAAGALPLRSAMLVEGEQGDTRMIIWAPQETDPAVMDAAKAHAESAYQYFLGKTAAFEGETIDRKRFIVIPLVVARKTFGVLQLEGAASLGEGDLVFVNAIANQLALALDRHRTWTCDITRRKEAEGLIERLRALVDNLDRAFVWEADAATQRIVYISGHVEKLLGYEGGECLESLQSWRDHVHPDDRRAFDDTFQSALSGRQNQRCQHRCIARDGREVWFHTGVHLAEAAFGAPRLQGVSVDITERMHAEEAQRFLLQADKALGATLDYSSQVQQVARLGIPKLGDLCTFEVVAKDGQLTRAAWAHVDPTMEKRLDELLAGSPSLLTVPVKLGDRTLGALSFAFDKSSRVHTEADRALAEELGRRAAFALENGRLYDEAQRAIRLRDQVLGIVSHDLRNPISAILMSADLLAETHLSDPAVLKATSRIERAARLMLRLTEDLIDFGSIEAGRLSIDRRPHDSAAMLGETAANFEAMALEKKVRLVIEVDPDLPEVTCDGDRIVQVLSNLVGNAAKVTSNGLIRLQARAKEGEILFVVSDTGPGIGAEDLEHIFERYWRSTQVRYRGTGLGLAIARGIVDAHGGRIWAESRLGEGATFFFTLPVSRSIRSSSRTGQRSCGVANALAHESTKERSRCHG